MVGGTPGPDGLPGASPGGDWLDEPDAGLLSPGSPGPDLPSGEGLGAGLSGADLAAALEGLDVGALPRGALVDLLVSWRRLGSWVKARELELVNVLAERYSSDERFSSDWLFWLHSEIALGMTLTEWSAATLIETAATLRDRLPGTMEFLRAGVLDEPRARVMVEGVKGLSDAACHRVEDAILDQAQDLTTGQLRALVAATVNQVAAGEARARRECSERSRRLELRNDGQGTAEIFGLGLPAGPATAAYNRVNAIARAAKRAGDARTTDQLRSDVFLALQLGLIGPGTSTVPDSVALADVRGDRSDGVAAAPVCDAVSDVSRVDLPLRAHDAVPVTGSGEAGPMASSPRGPDERHAVSSVVTAMTKRSGHRPPPDDSGGRRTEASSGSGGAGIVGGVGDFGVGGRGAGGRPGLIWTGDPEDEAIPYQAPPEYDSDIPAPDEPQYAHQDAYADDLPWIGDTLQAGVPAAEGLLAAAARYVGAPHLVIGLQTLLGLSEAPAELGRYGSLVADIARQIADTTLRTGVKLCWTVLADDGQALHHGQSRYKPSEKLRELVNARDRTCRFPRCRRAAAHCDIDHTLAHDQGGPTCLCNLAPLCRRHHRLKQAEGWSLIPLETGVLAWTTPSGHVHVVRSDGYGNVVAVADG
ncbi:HNH endonuclease signature motif containing protein [Sphaerisporangium corydalis]|uniref:DUF222 domain-containing protein n=1 Tax=Sphaerisporangium corydalis TaxID=1441875 RepID=A0ABV9E8T3_9ACTN|nr:HNH endonuclease signature motif containing protein [Sphaerisporangium corydalis]